MTSTASGLSAHDRIEAVRARLGQRLAILGHHYQADSVIRHTDFQGDSLELARKIDGLQAEHIVFCGVFFMAESAAALARPGQKVHLPHADATCPMADMAPAPRLEEILTGLNAGRKVVPLAYVNTSAAVKAVCARFGGSVCTSANAEKMLAWALQQGDAVLFLPDRHLGANTANRLGIPAGQRHVLSVRKGEISASAAKAGTARLLLWPGSCAIHHMLKKEDIAAVRAANPGCLVVVHPECSPEVVAASDSAGSTSHIIRYCAEAPAGATIAIGTEVNLVLRLADRHRAEGKTIIPVRTMRCTNMAKTTEERLAELLDRIDAAPPLTLPEAVASGARLALERMLSACS